VRNPFRKKEVAPVVQKPTFDWMEFVSLKTPLLIVSREGIIRKINQSARESFFDGAGEIPGRSLQSIEPRPMWTRVAEEVRRAQQLRQPRSVEVTEDLSGRVWEFDIRVLEHSTGDHVALLAFEVTELKRMEMVLQHQSQYISSVHETTLGIINRLDTQDLLNPILTQACALTGVTDGFIYRVEPSGQEMNLSVGVGKASDLAGSNIKPGEGLAGRVWETGEPLLLKDYGSVLPPLLTTRHHELHAVVAVPLKSDSHVIGVLGLASDEEKRNWGSSEVEALNRVAQLASVALDNAEMYRSMQQELAERKRAQEAFRESEENYRLLFERSPLPMWVYDRRTLRFLAANDAAVRYYGYSREELLSMSVGEISYSEDAGALLLKLAKGIPELTNTGAWRHRKKDGTAIDVEVVSHEILFGGKRAMMELMNDVTERKLAEEALQKREEHFRSLIENASDLILIANSHGTLSYISPSVDRALYYSPEELLGRNLFEFVHPEDFSHAFTAMARNIQSPGESQPVEWRVRHKLGHWRVFEVIGKCVLDRAEEPSVILNARDITERKAAEEKLMHDALHDPLTNLPNRLVFMDRLGQAIKRSKRNLNYVFAVLFLDLDHFKLVNDSLGHIVGDELLVAMARRLEVGLRPGDTIARLGGDEFAILLEDLAEVGAMEQIAARIQLEVAAPFELGDQIIYTTASIGIAFNAPNYNRPEEILRDADTALYQAKSLGKSCHAVFNATMHEQAVKLLRLRTDLRQALDRNEFRVFYQPVVSLKSGRITGFEALVRWQHPNFGLLAPAQFIAVAEESNVIAPLGLWVLGEACRQTREWQNLYPQEPPLSISVNLSVKQLAQPDLDVQIEAVLQETGLSAQSLKLEITESVFMKNAESMASVLAKLNALGAQLQIDDFGTGYSSLSYLHKFPFDNLKIDRAFVSSMTTNAKNAQIVRTIVLLAHNLGMTVTAEGVETIEQLSELTELNCEEGQGYFFSKPVEACEVEPLIASQLKRGMCLASSNLEADYCAESVN
jgi:diguanylate cyclase (GGDEF)-like protein/PAS domain S-box-containing protein